MMHGFSTVDDSASKFTIGWIYIGLVIVIFAVALFIVLSRTVQGVWFRVRNWIAMWKRTKAKNKTQSTNQVVPTE